MNRHGPDRVINLEGFLHPKMKLVSQEGAEAANDHGLDGMVKVIARRCRNDTGQAARIGPERIALGNHVANEHTAGQRHQEVDGNGTQSGRPQIDIGRRKGRALDVSTNAFRRDDGNIAGHVETPKSRIYKEQADANQPRVLLSDISNDAAGAEFADPGTEDNQHTQRATAGNGVDDAAVYRNGEWFFDLSGDGGVGEKSFWFGLPGDVPVSGDWNEDGNDDAAVYRAGEWFFDQDGEGGIGENSFWFGLPTDRPVSGLWPGSASDDSQNATSSGKCSRILSMSSSNP